MAVCGIDVGNMSMLIAQTGKGGIDVILNEASSRQTASYVSIQGKQRFVGDAGAALARTNIKNTINCMKLLCGRHFDEPAVQAEIKRAPFQCVKMPHGGVGITVEYDNEPKNILVEHVLAVLLKRANEIVKNVNNGVSIGDAVLPVPYWFTDLQRRSYMSACEIAQVHCLKVVNEPTSIALGYGIYKSAKGMFSATEPTNVMFIDLGYSGYCVSIVTYIPESMKVLSVICDPDFGGRNVDDIIVEILAQKFQTSTKLDVRENKKAMLKLYAAAEKAKKTLSPHGVTEASVSVECLAEERDLSCLLKRDELEEALGPLVSRLKKPLDDCIAESGLTLEQISEVEIVGGSTRIALIKKTIAEILKLDLSAMNYGLKSTMNADEAVVRGGALQCAIESSRVKVKPFNIVDRVAYSMMASFDNQGDDDAVEIYSRGDEFPRKPKRLTFRRKDTQDFTVHITYADSAYTHLPAGTRKDIADFTIKMPNPYPIEPGMAENDANEPHDVRVTFNLDKNGCIYISKAELMIELAPEPVKEESKEETKTEETKNSTEEGKGEESAAAAEGTLSSGEPAKPRKFKKIDLVVETVVPGNLSRDQIKEALEIEASMAFEDQLIRETNDRRNDLESYIYAMRTKLDGSLKDYGSPVDIDTLKKQIDDAEEWLYGDEGYDATKNQYVKKLDELQVLGKQMESRLWEENHRPEAIEHMKTHISRCREFVKLFDEAHEHITDEDRDAIRKDCDDAEGWMFEMLGKQADLYKFNNPVLTVAAIQAKRQTLFTKTNPIMSKPKPKPKPAPTPTPPPAASEPSTTEPTPMDEATPSESAEPAGESKENDAESKEETPSEAKEGEPMDQSV